MKKIRPAVQRLKRGDPGRRFRDAHARTRKKRSHARAQRWSRIALGIGLILAGIFFMAVPGPGVIIALFGLLVLSTVSRRTARFLDRAEILLRRVYEGARLRWGRMSWQARTLCIALAIVTLAALATFLGLSLLPFL